MIKRGTTILSVISVCFALTAILLVIYLIVRPDTKHQINDRTLHIASTSYAPFYDEQLPKEGFFAEIVYDTFDRAGYDIQVDYLPWERTVEATISGLYDGLFGMWYSEDRAKDFIFTDPIANSEIVYFSKRENSPTSTTLTDLAANGYVIGAVTGYTYTPEFWSSDMVKELSVEEKDIFLKLLNDEVDLVIADRIVGLYILSELSDSRTSEIVYHAAGFPILPQHVVFPKNNPESIALRDLFNAALQEQFADKNLDEYLRAHNLIQ